MIFFRHRAFKVADMVVHVELFRRFYGPTMNAFEAAEKSGEQEKLHNQLLELAHAQNTDSSGGTAIPATFLRVTVCL